MLETPEKGGDLYCHRVLQQAPYLSPGASSRQSVLLKGMHESGKDHYCPRSLPRLESSEPTKTPDTRHLSGVFHSMHAVVVSITEKSFPGLGRAMATKVMRFPSERIVPARPTSHMGHYLKELSTSILARCKGTGYRAHRHSHPAGQSRRHIER